MLKEFCNGPCDLLDPGVAPRKFSGLAGLESGFTDFGRGVTRCGESAASAIPLSEKNREGINIVTPKKRRPILDGSDAKSAFSRACREGKTGTRAAHILG
jgi:hypothetical protein